jgi:hypothetical protein
MRPAQRIVPPNATCAFHVLSTTHTHTHTHTQTQSDNTPPPLHTIVHLATNKKKNSAKNPKHIFLSLP